MLRRGVTSILLSFSLHVWPGSVAAQQVDPDFWGVPNGIVYAMAVANGTLYLGGTFDYVGPHTGGGVPLEAVSGAVSSGFPKVYGSVTAAVSDGADGWYIGGFFDTVGGEPRQNLAHVMSDLSVASWNPGVVGAVAVSQFKVFAGGQFNSAGGVPVDNLAAFLSPVATGVAERPMDFRGLALQGSANPIRRQGSLRLALERGGRVTLEVFDVAGRRALSLLDGDRLEAGDHEVPFGRGDLAAGVYFARARMGETQAVTKVVVVD